MKKRSHKVFRSFGYLWWIMLMICLLVNGGYTSTVQAYCSSSGRNTQKEWVDRVQVGSVINFSGENNGYGDYTGMKVLLDLGDNSLVLTPGFSRGAFHENWRVWIDLNQNGLYDSNELVFEGSSSGTITAGITIPAGSPIGNTGMRISMRRESMPPACGKYMYGEVEDYIVTIQPPSDVIPPAIQTVVPLNNTNDVAVNIEVGVQFSENVNCATINEATFFMAGPSGYIPGVVSCNCNTATFKPISNLNYGTTYTASITDEVTDLSGNQLETTFVWSFITEVEPINWNLWSKTYGGGYGEEAFALLESADGFVFAGYSSSFNYAVTYLDIWIAKVGKQDGAVIWEKRFGSDTDTYDYGRAIAEDADGYIVAGVINSPRVQGQNVESDALLMKLSKADGSLMWQKSYGGSANDEFIGMAKVEGGYVLVGQTQSFSVQSSDMLVTKVDVAGNINWMKSFGGYGQDTAYAVCDTDSGYVVAGYTYSFGAGSSDCWVLKLDKITGDVIWEKTYGGSGKDMARSVIQAADNTIIVAGVTSSYGGGSGDGWLIKIDSDNGDVITDHTFGVSPYREEHFYSIRETADSFIATGIMEGGGYPDTWLLKIDKATGASVWEKRFGQPGKWEYSNAVIPVSSGGYLIGGATGSFGIVGSDLWLLRVDDDGGLSPSCPSGMGEMTGAVVGTGHAVVSGPTGTVGVIQTNSATPNTVVENGTNAVVNTQCTN